MVEIPPDYFPTSPTLSGAGAFPDNMSAPDDGIFDTPAHVAIINQQWVTRLLGMLDGLMYPEAWEAQDAETAYNELLELQTMLMSPANLLIPFDVFDENYSTSTAPAGNLTLQILEVPEGEIWKVESATVVYGGATMPSRIRLFHGTNPSLRHIIYQSPVASNVLYVNNSPIWVAGKTWIFLASDNTVNPTTILVSISGLRFKASV